MKFYPDKIIGYLSVFGRADFYPMVVVGGEVSYAALQLETPVELANGLEKEINSQLTPQNGVRATLVFIAHSDLGIIKGRQWHRYMAEVVPNDDVKGEDAI